MSGTGIDSEWDKVKLTFPLVLLTMRLSVMSFWGVIDKYGLITFIETAHYLGTPPLGKIFNMQLKIPTSLPRNFTLHFFVYSPISRNFKSFRLLTESPPLPYRWITVGYF